MTFHITIVGLNITGASIGLALGEYKEKVTRTGVDADPDRAKAAQKLGAVDKIERNLPTALENTDLIMLCEPTAESLKTLAIIAPDLADNKYLFDVGCSAVHFNEELARLAPDFKHHLNIGLTTNPAYHHEITMSTDAARKDFFQGGILFLAPTGKSSTEAVELAETLATMLNADLVFTDPVELDGLRTSTHHLPELMASSLVKVATSQAGWREARRMTDRGFFSAAAPVYLSGISDDPARDFIANRDNLIVWLDLVTHELQTVRNHLAENKDADLNAWYKDALNQLLHVQTQRQTRDWDIQSQPKVELPGIGERLGRLIGIGKKKK